MPVKRGNDKNGPYYRYGSATKYYYTPKNTAERRESKRLAILQGYAIEKSMEKQKKGKGIYDKTMNFIFSRGKKKNKLRDGEMHGILRTDLGLEPAMFLGPYTKTAERIRDLKKNNQKIQGRTRADTQSLLHDVEYGLAKNSDDIRKADEHYVGKMNDAIANKLDKKWNLYLGKLGIQSKMKLEDLGLLNRNKFKSDYDKLNEEDKKLYSEVKQQLTQEGYGMPIDMIIKRGLRNKKK